jgi:hypothetical protein
MFTQEGTIPVVIGDVKFAESKFGTGPNDFDICIFLTSKDDPNQHDWWRGEMSQNYGKGNFATMTQAEITTDVLRKLGFEEDDLSLLPEKLVGVETTASVKKTEKDGKIFYNVKYIGGGGDQPKEIDISDMKARLNALMGGNAEATAAPEQKQKQAAQTAAKPSTKANPFAKKSPFN